MGLAKRLLRDSPHQHASAVSTMDLFPAPKWTAAPRALLTTLALFVRSRRGLGRVIFETKLRHDFAATGFPWAEFQGFARRHRVVPIVYEVLRDLEPGPPSLIPSQVLTALRGEAMAALVRAEGSFQRLRTISQGLTAAGIPHAAYKGPALSLQAYGAVGIRTSGDLDVLVPRAKLEEAVRWAKGAGYTFPEWDGVERAWFLEHMNHVTGIRKSAFADAHLELHWRTMPPMRRPGAPTIDAWLAGPLEEVEGVPVLPWPRSYAANAEHHSRHGWSQLLLLVDCAVRPVGERELAPNIPDTLGVRVLAATVALAVALTDDRLSAVAPRLLQRTWLARDPYQSEVGEGYHDQLDGERAWERRRARFRALCALTNRKDRVYEVLRQTYLKASVAAGIVSGPRPNDGSPGLKRLRALVW